MGYVPAGVCWYLAQLIMEGKGRPTSSLAILCVLIRGASPEEAYEKTWERGLRSAENYRTNQTETTYAFRGLYDLGAIANEIEDLDEIIYQEFSDVSEEEFSNWITPKERLSIFGSSSDLVNPPLCSDVLGFSFET